MHRFNSYTQETDSTKEIKEKVTRYLSLEKWLRTWELLMSIGKFTLFLWQFCLLIGYDNEKVENFLFFITSFQGAKNYEEKGKMKDTLIEAFKFIALRKREWRVLFFKGDDDKKSLCHFFVRECLSLHNNADDHHYFRGYSVLYFKNSDRDIFSRKL